MAKARLYLTVPFAQKDAAKALGAKWDGARKLWYVPEGLDTQAFQRWITAAGGGQPVTATQTFATQSPPADASAGKQNVVMPSSDPHFVPYSGDTPPWE